MLFRVALRCLVWISKSVCLCFCVVVRGLVLMYCLFLWCVSCDVVGVYAMFNCKRRRSFNEDEGEKVVT